MKTKKVSFYLLVVFLSAVLIFSLTCTMGNFNNSRRNNALADEQNLVRDDFSLQDLGLESATNEISSSFDTGWKTFDGRNASLFVPNGTVISEADIFFELNSQARNSYYQNVLLSADEEYTFSLSHRGRFGADTLALIIGEAPMDESGNLVAPAINSSNLDQFMQMTDWLLNNNYLSIKVGIDPSIVVYSKKFSTAGSFVDETDTNFSLEPTEEFSQKWTVVFVTSDYYSWVEHNFVFTPETSIQHLFALSHVKSRGLSNRGVATTGEGNLIYSFSIEDSTKNKVYVCDESLLSATTKFSIANKGYTDVNPANSATPESANIWNVTEAKCKIEAGRASYSSYFIQNLTALNPVSGDAFMISQGVYKDFEFEASKDYFNVTFSSNSRYKQAYRIIALPSSAQISVDPNTLFSQIDYIEQYINADANLLDATKATIYCAQFAENGLFAQPLSEAFSLQKNSKHPIKVDVYNFNSSTSWTEQNVLFDNTSGDYNNGIKICFSGYGTAQIVSLLLDSISVQACTLYNTFEGAGTRENAYKIQTPQDFALFKKLVLAGTTFRDLYLEQTEDLDFSTTTLDCTYKTTPNFMGNYNGKGYTLSNITMDCSSYTNQANTLASLFYSVSGSVTNLGLKDSSFTAQSVSSFAYSLTGSGHIANCYANNVAITGAISNSWGAGIALIVTGNATLKNIYFNGTVSGMSSESNNFGVASYRTKTCSMQNVLTTTSTIFRPSGVSARIFENCATKTVDELKEADVLTMLNDYAQANGFNSWQAGTNSLPELTHNIEGISLKNFTLYDSTIGETINWYYSAEDSVCYLLVPNNFDLANLRVSYAIVADDVSNASVKIYSSDDNSYICDLVSGGSCDFSNLKNFVVKVSNSTYTQNYNFTLMQGGNATIFISLKNGDLDLSNINSDPNHNTRTTGTAKIVDVDGDVNTQQIKEIKGRGNHSWTLSKRPYQVKFENSFSMLGMKKSKTWLLIANHTDGPLSRTAIFYQLSTWFGIDFSVEFEVANVYINGNYNGMYLVTSKVQVDKNRINISEDDDYLLEIDNTLDDYQFQTDRNSSEVRFTIKNPDLDDLTTAERDAKIAEIKAYIESVEDKLYDQNVTFAELSTILDMQSFAKYYWVQELSLNYDAMYGSSYMYTTTNTQTGAKTLHMGPIWDMDNTIGFYKQISASYAELKYYNLLNDSFGATGRRVMWYNQLMQRQEFSDLIDQVFITNFKPYLSYQENSDETYSGIVGFAVDFHNNTDESALMNYARWSYSTMKKEQGYYMGGNSYEEAYTNLINYLKVRIDFYYGEYKDVMFNSLTLEYTDANGFKSSINRDISNAKNIVLSSNIDKTKTITIYGVDYNNEKHKINEIMLTDGVYTGTFACKQSPSITVQNKTNNCAYYGLNLSVEEPFLSEIVVQTPPSKLNYFVGQDFDPTGMVVKGVYSDGSSEILQDYQISYSPFVEGTMLLQSPMLNEAQP